MVGIYRQYVYFKASDRGTETADFIDRALYSQRRICRPSYRTDVLMPMIALLREIVTLAASPGLRFFGTVNRDRRQRPPSDEPYGGECLVRVPPPGPGAAWRSSSARWPATAAAIP